jgi:hypothetical protein
VLRQRSRQAARLGARVILRQTAARRRPATGVHQARLQATARRANPGHARRIQRKRIPTVRRITTAFRRRVLRTARRPSRVVRHGRTVRIRTAMLFTTVFRLRSAQAVQRHPQVATTTLRRKIRPAQRGIITHLLLQRERPQRSLR